MTLPTGSRSFRRMRRCAGSLVRSRSRPPRFNQRVHAAGTASFFEEVDGIGESVAFKDQPLDLEGIRVNCMIARRREEVVGAFAGEGVEVESPEIPVAPFFDGASVLDGDVEDFVIVGGVVECASGEVVGGTGEAGGVFRAGAL
jgi:hypothetical protein